MTFGNLGVILSWPLPSCVCGPVLSSQWNMLCVFPGTGSHRQGVPLRVRLRTFIIDIRLTS